MKGSASLLAMLAIAAGTLVGAASGCELIASVDRNKIQETGGSGGEGGTTNAGGNGGTSATTSTGDEGGGGTTTSSQPNCVNPAEDCGTPTGECKVFSCVEGECVEGNIADGDPARTQTTGDCKKNVCQGGLVESVNDDTDPLDDDIDCTQDVCENGEPESNPEPADEACSQDGGKVCDGAGACVECNDGDDCEANEQCAAHNCIPVTCTDLIQNGDETDIDCGGPVCNKCDTGLACEGDGDCYHGKCDGGTCAMPTCDDGILNGGDYLLMNGETDVDCGGPCGPTCGPMKGCNIDGDCVGMQCSGVGGVCVPNCLDKVENNDETDEDCGGPVCSKCAIGKDCEGGDENCVSNAYCEADVCTAKKANGVLCGGANQCTSMNCVDGLCCNTACGATCFACDVSGSEGTCTVVPVETDPDNECMGNGGADVCNGGGACAEALASPCAAGGECASGNCADGVCCATTCDSLCEACTAAKTGGTDGTCGFVPNTQDPDDECAASLQCNGSGACQPKLANGTACTVGAECSSGNCVDGFCCSTVCNGLCLACSAAKKGGGMNGTCGSVAVDTDPDNECDGALDCNGSGACNLAAGESCSSAGECQSNFCVDGVCCGTVCNGLCERCNGAGSMGTCTFVPAGSEGGNECPGAAPNEFCDGAGACGLGAPGAPCVVDAGCENGDCLANNTCN